MVGPQIRQIGSRVWQFGTFEFTQYAVGDTPFAVLEGGISAQAPLTLHQLQKMGRSLNAMRYLCILHGHFDHLGTFPLLREKAPQVRIASGEKNTEILSNPRVLKRMLDASRSVTAYAREIHFLPEVFEMETLDPIPVHLPMKDREILTVGSISLQFLALPGHSPDAMGIYLPEEGICFVSDMAGLYFPDGTLRPNYYYSLWAYESSLERLLTLNVETLCFGHNGCLTGYRHVKSFLERSVDFTEKLKRQILDGFESGQDLEKLAQQFARGARKGFLSFFPFEHNLMLSRLIIRRTLEYYGLPTDGVV